MGSNHLERQGEGEGTVIKFVIGEELKFVIGEELKKRKSFDSAIRT
jgi:hypothetical protein